MKMKIEPLLIVLAFICQAVAGPKAQAVSPAPDGGYPGGNTAEGQNALLSLTTGGFNTAVGFLSLRSNTLGAFNTGIGAGTLVANTGNENTATGVAALLSNTSGFRNTATGFSALFNNTTGARNTATGNVYLIEEELIAVFLSQLEGKIHLPTPAIANSNQFQKLSLKIIFSVFDFRPVGKSSKQGCI